MNLAFYRDTISNGGRIDSDIWKCSLHCVGNKSSNAAWKGSVNLTRLRRNQSPVEIIARCHWAQVASCHAKAHHCLIVSYDTTTLRLANRSSMPRKLRVNLWWSQTAWLMTSGGNR